MSRSHRFFWLYSALILLLSFLQVSSARATAPAAPLSATAYELIDAVNALRAQNGLPAYGVNSILMSVAQGHSDYQASIKTVTHYGADGSRPYQRALAAGYPLAGDLSQGGFYSENIMGGPGLTAQSVVNEWTGDSDHRNTMLSPNLTEIGAGVTCNGNYCYFTLDAAQPSNAPVTYTPPTAGATVVATAVGGGRGSPTVVVVTPNTPKPDGSVVHVVQPGETLYTIATAYKTTVDSLKALNRLTSDLIYPGDTLLIFPPSPTQTAAPTGTRTPIPTSTPFVFWTVTSSPEPTGTPIPISPVANQSGTVAVAIIIISALVLAGVLTAAGGRSSRKNSSGNDPSKREKP